MLTGSLLTHCFVHTTFAFNAIKRPLTASLLMILRLAVLLVPLAWLGEYWFGIQGIYGGMATATVLAGIVALIWFKRIIQHEQDKVAGEIHD